MIKCENCVNLDYCVEAGEPCADYLSVFEGDPEFDEDLEKDWNEGCTWCEDAECEDFEDSEEVDLDDFDIEDEFDMDDYTGGEDWEDFCEHEDFE